MSELNEKGLRETILSLVYDRPVTVYTVPDEDIKFLEDILINIAFIQTNELSRKLMGETLNEAYTAYKDSIK